MIKFMNAFILTLVFLCQPAYSLENQFNLRICGSHSDNNKEYQLSYDTGSVILIEQVSGNIKVDTIYANHKIASLADLPAIQKGIESYMVFPKLVVGNLTAFIDGSSNKVGISVVEFVDGSIDMILFNEFDKQWDLYSTSFCRN